MNQYLKLLNENLKISNKTIEISKNYCKEKVKMIELSENLEIDKKYYKLLMEEYKKLKLKNEEFKSYLKINKLNIKTIEKNKGRTSLESINSK